MRTRGWSRASIAAMATLVLVSCGSATGPGPGQAVTATLPASTTGAAQAPSSVVASPAPGPSREPVAAGAPGLILFARHNLSTDDSTCFSVRPDGTGEAARAACGPLSPDGTRILTMSFKPNGFGPLLGGRPAITDAAGNGYRVLDAYPDREISLSCSSWSPDGDRFLCESGEDSVASDDGIYTVRASDGGDLRRISSAPAKHEDQPWGYAPDGAHLLFQRMSDDEPSVVEVVRPDGTGLQRLSPPDLSASDFSVPATWSPDGSRVAFSATKSSIGLRSLFVIGADGTGLEEISPTDVGAASAQWSPDGQWIAFTSRTCCGPQVWIVHPDGTGARRLTAGTDGSTSLAPVWSPDGSKLLFHRDLAGHETLRTVDLDGSADTQVADGGDGFDVGSYWWLPAPAR